jgi:hypothetical protein
MADTLYDVESFPNFFCVVFRHVGAPFAGVYEISERRNDIMALASFVPQLERMAGFNNIAYDYLMLHYAVHAWRGGEFQGVDGLTIAKRMHEVNNHIFASPQNDRPMVWERDRLVPQLDLLKIHHLDNKARMTSLKALQFGMRSPSIVETPVPFGTWLTWEQMDQVITYCVHDVGETGRFMGKSSRQIEFRDQLDATSTGGNSWVNLSDASIGKRFFRERLEAKQPGCTKAKTIRGNIALADVILPWIRFRYEPFDRKMRMLQATTVHASNVRIGTAKHETAGGFGPVIHRGVSFDLGAGGLHASVKKKRIESTADLMIADIDVTSFYPRLAIVNRFYPLHLGEMFCDVYDELFEERKKWPKNSPENLMYKLALNAVYGDSNNQFGPFYDPAYTLKITINGQLLLLMLAEAAMDIPGLEVIQANTDGLTFRLPRDRDQDLRAVCAWWEYGTGLNLERKDYSRMFVRDVNNYLAVPAAGGPCKRIGAYEYELDWWQDPSALCVPRAAEAALVHDVAPAEFLAHHLQADPWDFMLRTKVNRTSRLYWGNQEVQRVSRYYMSTGGQVLTKVMPPLKNHGNERHIAVQKGRTVQLANTYDGSPPRDVALDWYVAEARKLVIA